MTVYLSLGANLGNREQTISRATDLLRQLGTIAAVSDYFYSDPWGYESAHAFCNICLRMETTLSAPALLERTQAIKELFIDVLPTQRFYEFMEQKIGKWGGATKFPRVLKGKRLEMWEEYVKSSQ